jgi:heptosyltransferase-3
MMSNAAWWVKMRRHSGMRRLGKRLEKVIKAGVHRIFLLFYKKTMAVDPVHLEGVRRILLLRPNFRIGNTLISLPLIDVLKRRFPDAQVDYLGADTTAILLKGMPLNHVFVMSRDFIFKPWAYFSLLYRLRCRKYDLLLQVGNGSFSGMICMGFLGARYRMGAGEWAEELCNLHIDLSAVNHAYDDPVEIAHLLGVPCRDRPYYRVTLEEREKAMNHLNQAGFEGKNQDIRPFVALFVGGHESKRWLPDSWIRLAKYLVDAHARVLVLIGPEEAAMSQVFKSTFSPEDLCVMDPMPLRDFAAVLEFARLVITPDTGPMHLAIAMDVPTVAILQSQSSLKYAPRGELDRTLFRPELSLVYETLLQHPYWGTLATGG